MKLSPVAFSHHRRQPRLKTAERLALDTCSWLSVRRQCLSQGGYNMAGRLQDKVAIITGASRGLGQYVALGYTKVRVCFVITARTETGSNPQLPGTIYHTAKLVEEAGGEAFA